MVDGFILIELIKIAMTSKSTNIFAQKSFDVYILNRIDERIYPCGTPAVIGDFGDRLL